jgi:hypothetical protein
MNLSFSHLGTFIIFIPPAIIEKLLINDTVITPADVAPPPPIPAYNLPELKGVEDNQTALKHGKSCRFFFIVTLMLVEFLNMFIL